MCRDLKLNMTVHDVNRQRVASPLLLVAWLSRIAQSVHLYIMTYLSLEVQCLLLVQYNCTGINPAFNVFSVTLGYTGW